MTPRILLLGEMAGVHGATRLATHAGCNAASLTSNRMTHKSLTMFRGRRNVGKKPSPCRFHTSHIVASSPAEIAKDVGDRKNPLTKQDLVAHLRSGCKPKEEWRVGTEHEKFGFKLDTLEPMTFENIRDILEAMKSRFGYKEVMEGENIIGLKKDGASISLEPGGQFELSGAPFANVHETCNEVNRHLNEVNAVAKELGIGFAGMGFDPKWSVEARPHMPKARYEVIDNFVPTQGERGLEVMYSTCTAQVNLDFSSEKDMINKFRVGLSLQPIATALFANSPFTEGKPNGYLSYRSYVWTVFDDARTGELPFVFDEDFGFDKFTDYALDVPMYMVYRNNRWNNCSGESFKDFMAGKLPQFPGDRPTLNDWMNHLGNIYPEVRLKTYLEMRGADCGAVPFLNALPAFWVGLLYDEESLRGALDITHDWTNKDRDYLRQQVPKHGLRVPFRDGLLQHVAQDILKLSKDGLARRGYSEGVLLEPIEEVARTGVTLAERMLKAYHEKWGGNVDPLFEELAL